jgi:hypothetical protein
VRLPVSAEGGDEVSTPEGVGLRPAEVELAMTLFAERAFRKEGQYAASVAFVLFMKKRLNINKITNMTMESAAAYPYR